MTTVISNSPYKVNGSGDNSIFRPGSSNLFSANSSAFSRFKTIEEEEKRSCRRWGCGYSAALIKKSENDLDTVIPAKCVNISNDGLYAIVPMGYGVAIRQRYTFQLTLRERCSENISDKFVCQEGEIARAELLFGDDGFADHIGIGVRFFGNLTSLF